MKRRLLLALGVLVVLVAIAAVPAWQYWTTVTADLPDVGTLEKFEPAEATVLYDRNGQVLGELYEERRYVLPIEQIPAMVQNAFIAAEDASFRDHGGVDYLGIVRAALRNADEGRVAQGASTITQQVVRNLLLNDRQKTVERKLREVLLAWRVEDRYSKDYILYLYLNSIYMGAQSYGVEAAARTYFGRHAGDLTLSQAAVLAGLPQRPSDYNPYKNLDRARQRQRYVLDQMVDKGFVDQATADAAWAEPIELTPPNNHFLDNAPHFTEHVRRLLVEEFGEELVNKGGLQVTTTCDLALQQVAQNAVQTQVTALDRRSGFRRVHVQTLADEAAIAAWRTTEEEQLRGDAAISILEDQQTYDAVVLGVASDRARVGVGSHELMLSISDHRWMQPQHPAYSFTERLVSESALDDYYQKVAAVQAKAAAAAAPAADGTTPAPAGSAPAAGASPAAEAPKINIAPPGEPMLQVGDVVKVQVDLQRTMKDKKGTALPMAEIIQPRELEAALLSMDLSTGAVRALVGGADFTSSQFNRAIQGRRQVGSTFKPFVYAAAIEAKKVTAATIIDDDPVSIPLAGGKFWQPKDYGDTYGGPMTLAKALAESKNTVLVRTMLLADEGMNHDLVYKFARRLGLGGPATTDEPEGWVATPDNDYLCPWTTEWVSSIVCFDHYPPIDDGTTTMREHRKSVKRDTPHSCRSCDYTVGLGSTSLTLAEMVRAYGTFGNLGKLVDPYYIEEVRDRHGQVIARTKVHEPRQVMEPGVAYVMNYLLQGVIQRGTATKARELGVTLAGKTGTTNDGRDAWFIGMTPDVITGVWVGFDTPQTMGARATGGHVALPVWLEYMKAVAPKPKDFDAPPAGSIEWANIDESSGTRVEGGGRRMPFLVGTTPKAFVPAEVPTEAPPSTPVEE